MQIRFNNSYLMQNNLKNASKGKKQVDYYLKMILKFNNEYQSTKFQIVLSLDCVIEKSNQSHTQFTSILFSVISKMKSRIALK